MALPPLPSPPLYSPKEWVCGCRDTGSTGTVVWGWGWRSDAGMMDPTGGEWIRRGGDEFNRGVMNPTQGGIDPTSTANLFSEAVCIGEKIINGDECFILKLEANPATLRARSSATFEIIHHTIWGYFSRRIGLLIHLEDSHLLCVKSGRCGESIFWETGMESVTKDYCYINAINIVHAGETHVTPFRYAWVALTEPQEKDGGDWSMQEVDFNTWGWGLSTEVLLPPADFKREEVGRVLPPADLKREEVGRTL
ncbi:uncharacterized protein [Elaeis guineensis]|uniref:uncharacterized protein n=1 Tax=Elaeis guineensis var. tenera TaxID=51953 RepID=UPI003C6CCCFC